MKIYSAIEKDKKLEKDGAVYQFEIDKNFKCDCGKTTIETRYIKESLHGLLLLDHEMLDIDFIRRYAHSNIVQVANLFNELLDRELEEERYQKFIEHNPVLFAKFCARKIFVKPTILGKYTTDFVIYTSTKELLFIEIERPSMSIFKNSGHLKADVNHAYSQVNDWLREYSKYSGAILDQINLKLEDINAVKGVVILGRSSKEKNENIQNHMFNPPYQNIEFLTYDELTDSMLEISRRLS